MKPAAILVALTFVVAAIACSGDPNGDARGNEPAGYDAGPVRYDSGVVAGSHDCVPPGGDGAEIAWRDLANPIYEEPAMTKDQTVRFADGRWHLWFSTRSHAGMGYATSTDWSDWTAVDPAASPDSGGSADISRASDGRYVLAHQVANDQPVPESSKVAYRVSADPAAFSVVAPQRLAPGVYDDERLIDVALAHTDFGVFAIFKRGLREQPVQTPTLVHSPSGDLAGPWNLVGDVASIGRAENFQLLTIDGGWHLLVTSIPYHDPTLHRMGGDPADPASWLEWEPVGVLEIPAEDWNTGPAASRGFTHDVANSAYLCDARHLDGYFYLLYAGSTELETNDGRGHQQIGVARSSDLVAFQVPGGGVAG